MHRAVETDRAGRFAILIRHLSREEQDRVMGMMLAMLYPRRPQTPPAPKPEKSADKPGGRLSS